MATGKPKKKRGSVSASGAIALRFKKGSPQDSSTTRKPVRTKRLKDKKKVIAGSVGTRQSGESVKEFKDRRNKYRASLKKRKT